jgi:hypothetical protein
LTSGVYLSPRAMRHAGSVRHRPVTPPVGNNKVLATERSTEQRIRERKEVCERAHTTCPPEHCRSMHFPLSLRSDAASLRLLYSFLRLRIDRHGKKWTIGWPGHRQRPVMTKNSMPTIRRQLPFRSVSCLSDSARCPLHWKSWQAPAPATDTLELVCKRKRHLSRRR